MIASNLIAAARQVLNVGGNDRRIPIPDHYQDWRSVVLDVDAGGKPDLVCDARDLTTLPAASYDAVYCSHNLEHYFAHDVPRVLRGFLHVLKPGGFAEIRVPDIDAVMRRFVADGLDIDDVLYESPAGPISVHDVLYGFGRKLERTGKDFYAHKTGFTPASLPRALHGNGFEHVLVASVDLELRAFAFRQTPAADLMRLLSLPAEAFG